MATLVAALCACGPTKDGSTDGSTGSSSTATTMSSTTATTEEGPTTTATPTGGGTSSGTDSEGTTGMNGICPDEIPPGVEEQCASETDLLSCISWELPGGGCVWIPYFPVRLVDDMCMFGEPQGQCAFVPCSEAGCATLSPCGPEGFGGAFIVGEDDVVSVGFANWCLAPPEPGQPCIFDFEGQLIEGPPECACLCDPVFSGTG